MSMTKVKKLGMIWKTLYVGIVLILFCSCQSNSQVSSQNDNKKQVKIQVTSPAFEEGGMIPKKYTCDDENVSPPLAWTNVPKDTKSLALICDDPDAPMGTWVHWVIFNLPSDTKELMENIPVQKNLLNGTQQGKNDFGNTGYGGPCPPSGTHRYYFKIYALDIVLTQEAGITKAELLKAMNGHILAEGQIMGKYKKATL